MNMKHIYIALLLVMPRACGMDVIALFQDLPGDFCFSVLKNIYSCREWVSFALVFWRCTKIRSIFYEKDFPKKLSKRRTMVAYLTLASPDSKNLLLPIPETVIENIETRYKNRKSRKEARRSSLPSINEKDLLIAPTPDTDLYLNELIRANDLLALIEYMRSGRSCYFEDSTILDRFIDLQGEFSACTDWRGCGVSLIVHEMNDRELLRKARKNGYTPLHYAARCGNSHLMARLLHHIGALFSDEEKKEILNAPLRETYVIRDSSAMGNAPLHLIAHLSDEFLNEKRKNGKRNQEKFQACIALLLQHGADKEFSNLRGETPASLIESRAIRAVFQNPYDERWLEPFSFRGKAGQ